MTIGIGSVGKQSSRDQKGHCFELVKIKAKVYEVADIMRKHMVSIIVPDNRSFFSRFYCRSLAIQRTMCVTWIDICILWH